MLRLPFFGARRASRRIATGFGPLSGRPFAEADSPAYTARYERGAYRLEVRRTGYFAWEPLAGGRAFGDAVIEAEVEGDPANGHSAAGLLFRRASDENYYCLLAGSRGTWRFDLVFNNHQMPLVGWTPMPEPSGPTRLLRVVAHGTRFTVTVDGEWVGEIEDETLAEGAVCFAAQNYEERPDALFRLHRIAVDARPVEVEREHLRLSYYFPVQPAARLALAETLFAQGGHGAAAVQLRKALRGREGTPRERFLLAECYARMGANPLALEELDRVLAAEPAHNEARLEQAGVLYLSNRFLEARDRTAALLADPGYASGSAAWNLLGNAEYALGNWRRAADAYLRAVALEPGMPLLLRNAARALELAGDRSEALRRYLEAARLFDREDARDELSFITSRVQALEPANREVRELAARALWREGRHDDARRELEALAAEGSTDAEVHHLLGLLAVEAGDRAGALPLFERAAALEPDAAAYQLRLAETLHLLGRDPGPAMERAREIAPADPWLANLEGLRLLAAGDAASAADRFAAALAAAPREVDIRLNLSEALSRAGRLEEAMAAVEGEDDSRILNQRGTLHTRAGRFDAAVRDYEAAIRADPQNRAYRENCAAACLEIDLVSRAEELLAALAREQPTASVYNLLGNVAGLRGERQRAMIAWAAGLALDPGSPDIRANLAAMHLDRGNWQRARELVDEALTLAPAHAHAARLDARIKAAHESRCDCDGCGRTWWAPRELPPQPGFQARGEPPGDAPAGRCERCGRLYCVACASAHVVDGRLTCADCGGRLKLSDDALRWLFNRSVGRG
ncbi:MAG: tetratricopeptide repeat protein [Spirochaetes bacterium]|nr:tetratricopeptide repeat protein [Spirochaetota bacterium]